MLGEGPCPMGHCNGAAPGLTCPTFTAPRVRYGRYVRPPKNKQNLAGSWRRQWLRATDGGTACPWMGRASESATNWSSSNYDIPWPGGCARARAPPPTTGRAVVRTAAAGHRVTLRGYGRPRIRPKDPCLELRPKGIRKAPKGGVQKVVPPVTLKRYGRGTCRPVQFQAGPSFLTPKDGPNGAWAKPDSVSAQPRGHAAFQRRFSAGTACFTAD